MVTPMSMFYILLAFNPRTAWEKMALTRRGYGRVFACHLIPLILLVSVAEGIGLCHWGKWQLRFLRIKEFTPTSAMSYELVQAGLFLGMVVFSTFVLQRIVETFGQRRSSLPTFKLMAYAFTPFFIAHLLNLDPKMSPWVSWGLGVGLTVWVLYHGVPQMLQPDPPQTFGIYLSAITVVVLASGFIRIMTGTYLLGEMDLPHSYLSHHYPAFVGVVGKYLN